MNKEKSWGEAIWERKAVVQREIGVIQGVAGSKQTIKKTTKGVMGIIEKDFLPMIGGKRLLDAGIGPLARHSIEFCKKGFDVTGVDISDTTLRFAKEHIGKSGCKIELIKDDLVELKKVKEKFDLVLCLGTFGHIPSFLSVDTLKSFNRVLNKDGSVILDFWIKKEKGLKKILKLFVYDTARWIKKKFKDTFDVNCSEYTPEEIKEMIERAGFVIKRNVGNLFLLEKQ